MRIVTRKERAVLARELMMVSRAAHVMQRTGLAMAGAMAGTFVAAQLAKGHIAMFNTLAFIATTLVSGLSVGTNVIVAQLWGARRHHDAGQAARHFLGLSIVVSLFLMMAGLLLNRFAMQLLGAAPDVIALSLPYSTIIFLVIPFTVLLQVMSSILQGTGDTKTPMYAMIVVNLLHILIAYPLIYGRWGLPALGVQGAGLHAGVRPPRRARREHPFGHARAAGLVPW